MPKIEETRIHKAGYACDFCGKVITDYKHNGLGGVNFWGSTITSYKIPEEEIRVKREWDNGYMIKIFTPLSQKLECWGLCFDCAEKVRKYMKARSKK